MRIKSGARIHRPDASRTLGPQSEPWPCVSQHPCDLPASLHTPQGNGSARPQAERALSTEREGMLSGKAFLKFQTHTRVWVLPRNVFGRGNVPSKGFFNHQLPSGGREAHGESTGYLPAPDPASKGRGKGKTKGAGFVPGLQNRRLSGHRVPTALVTLR